MRVPPLQQQRFSWPRWFSWLLLLQGVLITGIAVHTTPNADEPAHVAAGLYHYTTGRFDAYRVNPPLVRMWCTLPLWLSGIRFPAIPPLPQANRTRRIEWELDDLLLDQYGYDRFRCYLLWGRLMNLGPALLGSYYCVRWASERWGQPAAVGAGILWACCPNQLAWSATVCPDLPAAAFGLAANYHFARVQITHPRRQSVIAGVWMGLAIAAKSTFILLPIAVAVQSMVCWRTSLAGLPAIRMYLLTCFVALWVLATTYGYEGLGVPLDQVPLESHLLRELTGVDQPGTLRQQVCASIRCPFPADLLRGIDIQRLDFERGKRSYLFGEWRERGWWYYYAVCAACKIPAGHLGLLVFGLFAIAGRVCHGDPPTHAEPQGWPWCGTLDRTVLELLIPLILFGLLVSSQTGFGHHFRYAFPCLPYAYLLAARAIALARGRITSGVAWLMLIGGTAGGLTTWPNCHAYFNILCGGPHSGYKYLLESNLDWGADLAQVAAWTQNHPDARPLYHAVVTDDLAARMPLPWQPAENQLARPGYYIVSIQRVLDPADPCHAWQHTAPIARIGASLWVYSRGIRLSE